MFEQIYTKIIANIQKSLGKGSGWIDSVIDHIISISRYNPLAGSSYIKLPKELDHPRKGLINIQNTDDNEYLKWCLVRYLNPANHHPARITKADKNSTNRLDFKDIKFPVKMRGNHKIEKKKRIPLALVFLAMKIKKKHSIYVSKQCCEEKKHYVLIKDFNTFMYDHSLHRGIKHFCYYYLHAFITEEILKHHIKDYFKINGKQTIKMPKKGEYVKFKNFEKNKIKSPFTIYADFESILVHEDNGKQNPNKSYTSKYQKHVACSYSYKLVCIGDKFSKPFKSYLNKDHVYNFISSTIEESKSLSNKMEKHFNKELVMTKEDNVDFQHSTKC